MQICQSMCSLILVCRIVEEYLYWVLNADIFLMVSNRVYPDETQCVAASNQGPHNLIICRLVYF